MPRRIKFPQPTTDESKSIAITALRAVCKAKQSPAISRSSFAHPRLLRITQAAQYLSVTNWFMETLLRENEIPSLMLGKRKVVDVRDLDAWVDKQKSVAA